MIQILDLSQNGLVFVAIFRSPYISGTNQNATVSFSVLYTILSLTMLCKDKLASSIEPRDNLLLQQDSADSNCQFHKIS